MNTVLSLSEDSGVPEQLSEDDQLGSGECEPTVGSRDGQESHTGDVITLELLTGRMPSTARSGAVDAHVAH